jgi:heme-degrading monooxygenase HmoA
MHVVIYTFVVRADCRAEFEREYGPHGTWVALFRGSAGFVGTELLRDQHDPRRYQTIDRWTDREAYARFRAGQADAYAALDARCEAWTERELDAGQWTAVT